MINPPIRAINIVPFLVTADAFRQGDDHRRGK